jgi:uncharacterized membrane protein YGL010W
MSLLAKHFADYGQYHKTQGNKLTHLVGIPLIVFSLFGMLSEIAVFGINFGFLTWLLGSIYYLYLDWKNTIPFLIFMFLFFYGSQFVAFKAHVILFILGWILQGIGHFVFEKKSPAFLTNLSHLLIGPLWIYMTALESLTKKKR